MNLKRPVPWAPANGIAAGAEQSPLEQPAPQDVEAQSGELPSFARLTVPARSPSRSVPQRLLLACAFAGGVAAGVGATYLVRANLPLGTQLQTMQRTEAPVADVARRPDVEASRFPADVLSGPPRPIVEGMSRASGDPSRALIMDSREVSALREQLARQFDEGRLDQPENDNALETYRKIAAIAPNDPATIELGGHLSAAFWSLAKRAREDARLGDALHYFGILKTLPPVPLAAIFPKQSPESSATGPVTSAGAAVRTLPEAAAAPPTPVISGEAAEPTKSTEAAPVAPIVMSPSAAGARSPDVATATVVAQPSGQGPSSEPTDRRDVA
jgi:hypothetical protein